MVQTAYSFHKCSHLCSNVMMWCSATAGSSGMVCIWSFAFSVPVIKWYDEWCTAIQVWLTISLSLPSHSHLTEQMCFHQHFNPDHFCEVCDLCLTKGILIFPACFFFNFFLFFWSCIFICTQNWRTKSVVVHSNFSLLIKVNFVEIMIYKMLASLISMVLTEWIRLLVAF